MPSASRPASPDRGRAVRVGTGVAVVLQLVVLYAPRAPSPPSGLPQLDKLVHAVVFALPVALALWAWRSRLVVPLAAAHGPVSEVIQASVLRDRSGDPWDVAADLAGVLAGWLLWLWARRRRARVDGQVPAGG